ncbi:MAG: hypothetical protein Q9191_002577 [Dirinaria sp. TL-2023a]
MNSQYETIPRLDEQKAAFTEIRETEESIIITPRSSRSRLWASVHLLLGFLWLAPIVVLLYLNLSGFRIGPSASCRLGGCKADPLGSGGSNWAHKLDRNDHNTLGGLQLVAKALEIWFLFVAISLVYSIAMILASRHGGLPIGLLTSPVEFADPRSLLEVFRAASRSPAQSKIKERALLRLALYLFVIFLAFMCILVNLMGPAVAVLVLPTLQWIDLPKQAQHSFTTSGIGAFPNGTFPGGQDQDVFPNCSTLELAERLYSCTTIPYAASLDSWDDAVVASDSNPIASYSSAQSAGISPEGDVFFTFNTTNNFYDASWAPNRQTLREISLDLDNFETASQNLNHNTAYRDYNSSLNTILKRKGPIFGALENVFHPTNITNTTVGNGREVRCYGGYKWGNGNYTKCLRIGTGWNPLNKKANFEVLTSPESLSERATVNVFFSDTSAYSNEALNHGLIPPSCLINGTVNSQHDCDWTNFFSSNKPDNASIVSFNILSVEISMPREFPGHTVVFEFFTFADFSTYTLDTSPQTNPLYLVQVDDLPDFQKEKLPFVPVDPDWFLAAWSVNQNGLIVNRSAATSLIRGFKATFRNETFANVTREDNGNYENFNSTTLSNTTSLFPDTSNNTLPPSYAAASPTPTVTSQTGPGYGAQSLRIKRQEASTTDAAPSAASSSDLYEFSAATSAYTSLLIGTVSTSSAPTATTTGLRPESDESSPDLDEFYLVNSENDNTKRFDDLALFVYYSHLQALSMVTFTKANLTQNNTDTKDPKHPTLWFYAQVHVWAYGTDSRTSKMGITVTVVGGVCVLVSTVLGLVLRRRERSLTELLLAAIEHRYTGELDHAAGDDGIKAKTRFQIQGHGYDEEVKYQPVLH